MPTSASTAEPTAAGQRWLARIALGAMLLALLVLIPAEGAIGLTLVVAGLVGAGAVLAGGYWFLAKRGLLRWAGLALAIVALLFVIITFFRAGAILVALISLALVAVGGATARHALRHTAPTWMPTTTAKPAQQPFIVMNPRSGGGKVVRFDLKNKAEALGAEVALMEGPGHVDVAAIVRDAVTRGADLLGVAGGDGTQALVAGIAADHDLPLLVITAGTRNHFALDLGLDREDPSACLDALADGEDVRIDLGMIGGRPFVNNASFGAYAEIVQSPQYRDNKERTMLSMLPDLLSDQSGGHLQVRVGTATVPDVQAVLVSNNPYGDAGRLLEMGRRFRLDQGVLGVVAGRLDNAAEAVGLLAAARSQSITTLTSDQDVVLDSDAATLPVGIDGEAVTLDTPVRCTVRPLALRVRLPKNRPGVPRPRGKIDWTQLWRLAFGRPERSTARSTSGPD